MSHTPYFAQLNARLRQQGIGEPTLLLDLTQLNNNLDIILQQAPKDKTLRLVSKSLPSIPLLKYIANKLNTHRFMTFHTGNLPFLLNAFACCDILFGKPMPNAAVKQFLKNYTPSPQQHIHWLIDTPLRLQQYLHIAQNQNFCLSVNIEIDVGLHRGGITHFDTLTHMLQTIANHPAHLRLHGLMGYDAHIAKIPTILGSAQKHYTHSQQCYQAFIAHFLQHTPQMSYCFNGAGSLTLSHHFTHSICNDLSLGSLLVKPLDCDIPALSHLVPALFIATPILKLNTQPQIPGIAHSEIFSNHRGYFIFGGKWMAKPCSPRGLMQHVLYGSSSNQDYWITRRRILLDIDDFIFFRPTQSEALISQFPYIEVIQDDQHTRWATFLS